MIVRNHENTSGPDVFFNDFTIEYKESNLIQTTACYPYGMIAYTWMRDAEILNRNGFQGKEWEDKTQWYDFHARQYDPALGRWFALDPANQFASGYMGMGNNPVIGVDPDGRFVNFIIGAVVGAFGGYSTGKALGKSGWDLFGYIIAGAGIGVATSGVGTAVTTSAGSALAGGAVAGAFNGAVMAALAGQNPGQGALYGALGGLAGSTAGLAKIDGIVPGALYGAATGGTISGALSYLSGGSFIDGFKYGAVSGGILGGIYGGLSAAQSKYKRNIIFGGVTRTGKQNYLNDLATSSNAYEQGLEQVKLAKNGDLDANVNGQTRPIIDGKEGNLTKFILRGKNSGTKSNVYMKSASLKQMASTFGHEMVHVNDIYSGYAKNVYRNLMVKFQNLKYFDYKTPALDYLQCHLEYRACQYNVGFGYRTGIYQTQLNNYLNYANPY